jgi:hypothetical protein
MLSDVNRLYKKPPYRGLFVLGGAHDTKFFHQ